MLYSNAGHTTMYQTMHVKIANAAGAERTLEFSLRPTAIAQKWAACVAGVRERNPISDRQRWFNFPHQDNSPEFILAQIHEHIARIRREAPGLIPEGLERLETHEFLLKLHAVFVGSQDKVHSLDPGIASRFKTVNLLIHAFESQERSQETAKTAGIPEASWLVLWEGNGKTPLADEDYAGFTIAKKFGTVYLSYCQAGTHLYEMFLEKNTVLPPEQIRPLRHYSADSYFWFGSTTGPKSLLRKEAAVKEWFQENEALFHSLGFEWGDPRLAIGWLPVANLSPPILELDQQVAFIAGFAGFTRVTDMIPS